DGDNFLGGRDIDNAVVDWALGEIERRWGLRVSRADPRHAAALRQLKQAAEDAKIELSRGRETTLQLPAFALESTSGGGDGGAGGGGGGGGGDPGSDSGTAGGPRQPGGPIELPLDRARLEAVAQPILERSFAVCERLLAGHGLGGAGAGAGAGAGEIERIVLV